MRTGDWPNTQVPGVFSTVNADGGTISAYTLTATAGMSQSYNAGSIQAGIANAGAIQTRS